MADRTSGDIVINSDRASIMNVIADLSAYPLWSVGVTDATVLDVTEQGRPARAQLRFESGPISDTYVLTYEWRGDERVDWGLETPGELIKLQNGTYRLTSNDDGTVTVSYDLTVELAVPMIGKIRQKAEKLIVKTALQGLKERVESLSAVD